MANDYAEHGAFVPALGQVVLDLLEPVPGERILDLGCGDGALTERLVAAGCRVVGVDTSAELLAVAESRELDVRYGDARALDFDREFDAVFSNAVLHWVPEPARAATSMYRALVPGGRVALEFGGFGNIAAILTALRAVLAKRGFLDLPADQYYPTPGQYAAVLAEAGFVDIEAVLVPRQTPLPTGMDGWLRTFRQGFLDVLGLSLADQEAVRAEVVELLRPALCDVEGNWVADYVRLRVTARRP